MNKQIEKSNVGFKTRNDKVRKNVIGGIVNDL